MLTQRTTTSAPGASRGRSAEIYHLPTAAREPGCWDHIGRHMRADAEPVRRTTRNVKPEQPHSTLARICLVVMLLSVVAAVARACGAGS